MALEGNAQWESRLQQANRPGSWTSMSVHVHGINVLAKETKKSLKAALISLTMCCGYIKVMS